MGFEFQLPAGVQGVGRAGCPVLYERDNPGEQLIFHFMPETFSEDFNPEWPSGGSPGASFVNRQFSGGIDQVIPIRTFWNEFGQGKPIQMSVEDSLNWLEERTTNADPATGLKLSSKSPPVLVYQRGRRSTAVVLAGLKIEVVMLDSATGVRMRAYADLTLKRWTEYGIS